MTDAPDIALARVYDAPGAAPGARLLVDRVWPRGVSKEALELDDWIREVAPSDALRKWFHHDPGKWDAFQRCYCAELDQNDEAVERCLSWRRKGPVVLLYGAKDREHNQAVVLRAYLHEQLRQGGAA
ncbi:DUF488 domain-containing protein [Oceanibium sediminis]|uniref:DUF488 domain-containing protein n=1 Tax=Oceanibium sediminis TaxID=2026339 RepID=UPI000DD47800|nr:DUF488 family protein [Oceanibium sediminis]